jgi:hypothetical protein
MIKHTEKQIAQYDVLIYEGKGREGRWQDMTLVCDICPRGLESVPRNNESACTWMRACKQTLPRTRRRMLDFGCSEVRL